MINELLTSASLRMCLGIGVKHALAKGTVLRLVILNSPIESRLVGRIVEYLQELTSSKVEHELRVNAEALGQLETRWILLAVIGELLTEPDEHAIEPSEDIR